jgi:glycosyltransferase involved in cell wall biosynthesis
MTFSVVTPCRDAAARLGVTLDAVASQTAVRSGTADLQHIVVDGASADGTAELVRRSGGTAVELVSEPDRGMYDALAKGLRRATGEWITYLNAGDTLDEHAFEAVLAAAGTGNVSWLTGRSVMQGADGKLLRDTIPFRYRRSLILAGQYCRRAPLFLPFLQQEGTFWRRELNAQIDLERLAMFRLAGDYYLWRSFAATTDVAIVPSRLGIFHRHAGQMSEDRTLYHQEVASIADPLRFTDFLRGALDGLLWHAPPSVRKIFYR